ncbi:hypothetical protein CUMW_219280 [Citrus unshiu]|uniref:Uncharacterized protein n=1 Tax=Citrus unshiu TaxID=55188 RepID=A0A2H5QD95_CITUN|nr:hypothetical protein CUMW_219280 [Citrus unshiu]
MYAVNLLKHSRIPFPEIYDPSFIPANYLPHANNVGKSHFFQAVATILTKVPFDQLINIMYIVTQPDHKHF